MASGNASPKSQDSSPEKEFFQKQPEDSASQIPDGSKTERATSSGGPGGLPAPDFPQRDAQPPGPQAHDKLLKPPYATPKVAEGNPTKSDYASMSGSKMVETVIAQAARDAAVAAAAELHPDDPQAASICVVDAMQSVLVTRLAASGTPATDRTTPHSESKFSQQAILSGICDSKDLDKAWEKEKGSLYKNSKLIPAFPGSRCRTEPDTWENWWERVCTRSRRLSIARTLCWRS